MNDKELIGLLEEVVRGAIHPNDAASRLKLGPFRRTELDYATLDHHRALRHRLGEVVYGESKTKEQILGIVDQFSTSKLPVLITRLNDEKRAALKERFPEGRENAVARTFICNPPLQKNRVSHEPYVAVLAAGTSDLPVSEEAVEVCVAMNIAVERLVDIGVSGLHRLLEKVDLIHDAAAVVVVAGMEGALPSVVAGLVGRPVYAVPTSVGYGASFGGVAALLGMLNSCAPGVTVVNIDNGFSAAFAACNVAWAVRDALDTARDTNEARHERN